MLVGGVFIFLTVEVLCSKWIRKTGRYGHSIVLVVGCVSGIASLWLSATISELKYQQDISAQRGDSKSTAIPSNEPKRAAPKKVRTIQIIFKDSPLFTISRRDRINDDLDAMYSYLAKLGFDIPKAIPPLGVGKDFSAVGSYPGDSIYEQSIQIAQRTLDDPCAACYGYVDYWIGNIIGPMS